MSTFAAWAEQIAAETEGRPSRVRLYGKVWGFDAPALTPRERSVDSERRISFKYLGCHWLVLVHIEDDDETTPGSVEVESIEGALESGESLPPEIIDALAEMVKERAREEVARG